MITKSIPQTRAVSGNTPQETELLFNQTMTELADLNPTYERDGNVFWVYYTIVKNEPETVVEEHEMKGEYRYCEDCPYCDRVVDIYGNIDPRVKWGKCMKYGMTSVNLNKRVCAAYWENEERR